MPIRDKKKRERRKADARRQASANQGKMSRAYKLPPGLQMFTLKEEGEFLINVVPYTAREGNPTADEGMPCAMRSPFWVHNQVGPNKDSWACPSSIWEEPCPIHECGAELEKDPKASDAEKRSCWAQKKQLMLVEDIKNAPGQVKLFDVAYANFGKALDAECARNPDYYDYASEGPGYSLKCKVRKESFSGRTFLAVTNIDFVKRGELSDEVLDAAEKANIDDMLVKPEYEQLKSLWYGKGGAEDDAHEANGKASHYHSKVKDEEPEDEIEEEEPETKPARKPKPVEDEDEPEASDDPTADELGIVVGSLVKHRKHGVCTVVKISSDGTSLRLEDEDMKLFSAVAPSECKLVEPEEDEPEDEEPSRKPATRTAKRGKAEEEPDEDEEEEEPDEDEPEEEEEEDEELDWGEEEDEKPSRKPATKKPGRR